MKIAELIEERCKSNNIGGLLEDIENLIAEGCDVNEPYHLGLTPLHVAVSRSLPEIAQKLLDNGANVNAKNYYNFPPLGEAIRNKNLELVCMLLIYGADVSPPAWQNLTPLVYALQANAVDIAKAILGFLDDFSCDERYGIDVLILAVTTKSPFAVDLVMAGTDLNCVTKYDDYTLLLLSLSYDDGKLFSLMWQKFDCIVILNQSPPFLETYITTCKFSPDQWLECLYLILDSPLAVDFVGQLFRLEEDFNFVDQSCMSHLFAFMRKNTMEPHDRLKLIYTLLSLGYKAMFWDFVEAYRHFGFGEELTALLYIGDNLQQQIHANIYLMPAQILQLYEANSLDILHALRVLFLNKMYEGVCEIIKFFSINARIKSELFEDIVIDDEESTKICRLVKESPEMPSLVELCRSKIRSTILKSNTITFPYQFHDMVNSLNLPQLIQDIIRFKAPIYS